MPAMDTATLELGSKKSLKRGRRYFGREEVLNVESATHPIGQASEHQCPNDVAKHTNC